MGKKKQKPKVQGHKGYHRTLLRCYVERASESKRFIASMLLEDGSSLLQTGQTPDEASGKLSHVVMMRLDEHAKMLREKAERVVGDPTNTFTTTISGAMVLAERWANKNRVDFAYAADLAIAFRAVEYENARILYLREEARTLSAQMNSAVMHVRAVAYGGALRQLVHELRKCLDDCRQAQRGLESLRGTKPMSTAELNLRGEVASYRSIAIRPALADDR